MGRTIAARELVVGDVVRVRAGDFVPADIEIADGALQLDESALTGESRATGAHAGDTIHAGSIVRQGESTGTVAATGSHTFFGRTTQLVSTARPKLHVERVISRVVRWLLVIVGAIVGVTAAVSLWHGAAIADVLPISLVLLMSAIPVALPVMFTVSMAVGARELGRRGVLVTQLRAVEDAANMNVLCADKTGTLTENRLALVGAVPQPGFAEEDVIRAGVLASNEANADPIDLAFLNAAKLRALDVAGTVVSFAPFSAETRRTEAVIELDGRHVRVAKGALSPAFTAKKRCVRSPRSRTWMPPRSRSSRRAPMPRLRTACACWLSRGARTRYAWSGSHYFGIRRDPTRARCSNGCARSGSGSRCSPATPCRSRWKAWQRLTHEVAAIEPGLTAALALSRANRDEEASRRLSALEPHYDAIMRDAAAAISIKRSAASVVSRVRHTELGELLVRMAIAAAMMVVTVIAGIWVARTIAASERRLAHQNAVLEERNRELDAFAGRVAHDLRGPLNTISMSAEQLAQAVPEESARTSEILERGIARCRAWSMISSSSRGPARIRGLRSLRSRTWAPW